MVKLLGGEAVAIEVRAGVAIDLEIEGFHALR
jgi:hypothetical protein